MTEALAKTQTDLEELIGKLAEEYAACLREGEKPDIEEYVRKYPQAADTIRQILPALEIMGAVPYSHATSLADAKRGMLGDYRIVREVGRGGMGVVYEAEQLSLSRRVALKVLPFAAVLDERQIKRFKNEALAAAQLDHPHIVDVHGVGCERSVHFYAMRFVDGETLAQVITKLRSTSQPTLQSRGQPPPEPVAATEANDQHLAGNDGDEQDLVPTDQHETVPIAALSTHRSAAGKEYFCSVARIGCEVAEALDHAHQQGVVHRDIKRANIMIDAAGKSWVTDFGLAHVETGASLTMTGDLLGTLKYMSPEQALAKRVIVDHRTDIYSLGATLYELLTLEPVFSGKDKQDLLRQIAFDEPRAPRRFNAKIPLELQIIVLKSIEKNPQRRYGTAQELADDL